MKSITVNLCLLWKWFFRLMAAIGLLWTIVTFTPVTKWWMNIIVGGPHPPPEGEVLVVLGGDRYDTRTIGVTSYWRCIYAAEAYREKRFSKVVVTGGVHAEFPISVTIRDCLVYHGIPKEAILLETKANSTHENALFVSRMLKDSAGKTVLLTSDLHIFRALRAFRKEGMEISAWPTRGERRGAYNTLSRWSTFINLCLETAKIGYYYYRGWI